MSIWTKFYLNLMMHMACLSIILFVVFFVIIVPAERDALRGELRRTILRVLRNVDASQLESVQLVKMRDELLRQGAPGMEALNSQTRVVAGLLAGGLSVLFLTNYAGLRLSCSYCAEFFPLALENLVTFAMVGVIEYLFFMHVAKGYAPTAPSLIAHAALAAVKRSLV
jgi:hypothetical protein